MSRLTILFERAMDKTITPEEHDELLAYFADPKNKKLTEKLFASAWKRFNPDHPVFTQEQGSAMLARLSETIQTEERPSAGTRFWPVLWYRAAVAASILLVVSVASYFIFFKVPDDSDAMTLAQAVTQAGIAPGNDRAVITLGDGRTITLDESGVGLLAEEAGIHINKLAEGEISYESSSKSATEIEAVTYNTIQIPKGGQYRLVLPDGTKVHLNSASTLRYPTRFTGMSREVELTGEAYFEVTQRLSENGGPATAPSKIPFIVKTASQQVEVLGTVFNINAYHEQQTKTTLVEGSVRVVTNTAEAVRLQPGEVATCTAGQTGLVVEKADLDGDLAWHNGYFIFNDENIRSIMERVARWYDVEVAYVGKMDDKRFGGIFQRSKSITQLLENFRTTGLVDFKITERRITVMAK